MFRRESTIFPRVMLLNRMAALSLITNMLEMSSMTRSSVFFLFSPTLFNYL